MTNKDSLCVTVERYLMVYRFLFHQLLTEKKVVLLHIVTFNWIIFKKKNTVILDNWQQNHEFLINTQLHKNTAVINTLTKSVARCNYSELIHFSPAVKSTIIYLPKKNCSLSLQWNQHACKYISSRQQFISVTDINRQAYKIFCYATYDLQLIYDRRHKLCP